MTEVRPVAFHRGALMELLRAPWTELWLVTPQLDGEAAALIQPHLRREGVRVRLITHLSPERLADGKVDLAALQALRVLPGVAVRNLPGLQACVYAAGPGGPALVTSAPLTMDGLDGGTAYGTWLPDSAPLLADLERWWEMAESLSEADWADLAVATSTRLEARTVGDEIAAIGAFVRLSVRGTRRSRRLDPTEFGVPEGEWGRAVRPVEVALYKLDEVVRAKEDLEAVLAEKGLEWNGYYLVSRQFLEREWPRIFSARKRQLKEHLNSPEGQANLKAQLARARQELEAFFAEIYPRAETEMDAETWVRVQRDRVLAETLSGTILEESDLEYRVLTILPEDKRSVEELRRLLEDPKLRSVQLTFHF